MLMGSAAASLCAWWALGAIFRVFRNRRFGLFLHKPREREGFDGR